MKLRALLCFAMLCVVASPTFAEETAKAKPAGKGKAAPAMDAKAMEEMMMKAAMPGPFHERLKKLEGDWNLTVKTSMDPSQPMEETKSTSVVRSLMDGRYCQEEVSGEMMGKPFTGLSLTGYDNILKKYVSTWCDNMGTGIMTSEGTPDASGNVINWTGQSSDPMTGKMTKFRMVSRFVDDNKHTFEMFSKGPDGKEMKMMEITYERKM